MKMILKRVIALISCLLVLGVNTILASASEQERNNTLQNAQKVSTGQGKLKVQMTKENIQNFLDDYFYRNMETFHVPGAAVSVVQGNQELLTAAYGFSDFENQIEVNADTTTFPACSVTKLFTATAVMQLYEQGKIDLNADITQYVKDIKINNRFSTPITCANLLTHSSGLDEQSELTGSTLNINDIRPQSEFFKYHIPTVIREPGTSSSYSNIGYNLLGYIVEKVSGQSYEKYVQDNILNSLNMDQSTVRIDNENMAIGYYYENSEYKDVEFAYQYTSGSSGVITTVTDMENFMIMHLNKGAFQDNDVLEEATEELMQQKQFANNDVFDGMGYGWIRSSYNDTNIIKHEGAIFGYATTMLLIPSEKIGIYVATNNCTGICFDFEEAFLNYFYGERTGKGTLVNMNANDDKADVSKEDLSPYVGTYRNYDGIAQKTLIKIGILFDNATDIVVTKNKNGILKVSLYNMKKELEETTLQYVGDGIFLRDDGKGYLTFESQVGSNGIKYAFTDVSHCTYQKIEFYETKPMLLMGLMIFFALLISAGIMGIRVIGKKVQDKVKKKYYITAAVGQIITVLSTLFAIVLVITMIFSCNNSNMYLLRILLVMTVVGVIMMLFSMIYGTYAIAKYKLNTKFKIYTCFLSLFQIISVWELVYFNLLGIHIF